MPISLHGILNGNGCQVHWHCCIQRVLVVQQGPFHPMVSKFLCLVMFIRWSQRVNVKQLSLDEIYVHQCPVILFLVVCAKECRELT